MKKVLLFLALAAPLAPVSAAVVAADVNVLVAHATPGKATRELTLPAELMAEHDTNVRARADGYVQKWLVDIGDRVKEGQLLAVIEAPDLDRRLDQAKATLENARAKLRIAKGNATRAHNIRLKGAVSPEEIDSRDAALAECEAAVNEAAAEAARYAELKSFLNVVAPFDGVVAERNIDVGRLVSANASGPVLFRITDNSVMRAYLGVPQSYIGELKPGRPAQLLLDEHPDKPFDGKVSRIAGALDPASRTLITEVLIPNSDGALLPGMYGRVRLIFDDARPALVVPAAALVLGSEGPRVAVVGAGDIVHFQKVTLGHDNGTTIEIVAGLKPEARVILNPGDLVTEGCKVVPTDESASAAGKN